VKEDVSVDVKDNYVLYHTNDEVTEISVIEDFNRVSIVGVTVKKRRTLYVCQP